MSTLSWNAGLVGDTVVSTNTTAATIQDLGQQAHNIVNTFVTPENFDGNLAELSVQAHTLINQAIAEASNTVLHHGSALNSGMEGVTGADIAAGQGVSGII